jgi:hypothetical protein
VLRSMQSGTAPPGRTARSTVAMDVLRQCSKEMCVEPCVQLPTSDRTKKNFPCLSRPDRAPPPRFGCIIIRVSGVRVPPPASEEAPLSRYSQNVSRDPQKGKSPSRLIDERIKELGDWRGKMLSQLRTLIKQADPEVVEEWKWVKPTNPGTPVWSHDGLICTGETYKNVVKMTFAKGAALEDPSGLFNSSLEGNTRRAIDFHEGEKIDEEALKALVRAAVTLNASRAHS